MISSVWMSGGVRKGCRRKSRYFGSLSDWDVENTHGAKWSAAREVVARALMLQARADVLQSVPKRRPRL